MERIGHERALPTNDHVGEGAHNNKLRHYLRAHEMRVCDVFADYQKYDRAGCVQDALPSTLREVITTITMLIITLFAERTLCPVVMATHYLTHSLTLLLTHSVDFTLICN